MSLNYRIGKKNFKSIIFVTDVHADEIQKEHVITARNFNLIILHFKVGPKRLFLLGKRFLFQN